MASFGGNIASYRFQLTASQGGRQEYQSEVLNAYLTFNSRPHKEADRCKISLICNSRSFNSRPHKEADIILGGRDAWNYSFNSRPHKEADSNFSQFFCEKCNLL